MKKDNIVKFPKGKQQFFDDESVNQKIYDYKNDFIEEVVNFMMGLVANELERANFLIEDEDTANIIFIAESIKSFMMEKHGMEHPLQDVAKDYFEYITKNEEDDEKESE